MRIDAHQHFWQYTEAEYGWIDDESARHLETDEVMYLLQKARNAGANLLMNIGPRADGSVHPDDDKSLRAVGAAIRNQDLAASIGP